MSFESQIREGIQAVRRKDNDKALLIFRTIIQSDPSQSWARYLLADVLWNIGHLEEAISVTESGISIEGASPQLICKLAELYGEKGDANLCDYYLTLAIKRFPLRAFPYIYASNFFKSNGEYEQAFAILHNGHAACPDIDQKDLIAEAYAKTKSSQYITSLNLEVWPPKRQPLIENACVIQLIKDEDDIILDQLEYNFRIGFKYFCIIDNNSTDTTTSQIKHFKDKFTEARVVIINDFISQHYQDHKTTAAGKFAVEYFRSLGANIEWIVPLDGDEFISFSSAEFSLSSILNSKDDLRIIPIPMINFSSEIALPHYPPGGIYSDFVISDRAAKRSEIKCIYKFTDHARTFLGNHFVSNLIDDLGQICVGAYHGVYIRHYPYRSIEHIKRKVVNGYNSVVAHPDVKGGAHWRQNWELYKQEGENWLQRYLNNYINRVKAQQS